MSDFDVHQLDGQIRAELHKQRAALAQLRRSPDDAPPRAQLDSRLWSRERLEQLRQSPTPHAATARAWLIALRSTVEQWPTHYRIAVHWRRPLGRDAGALSLHDLRARLLGAREKGDQQEAARQFARHAAAASRDSCRWLRQAWASAQTPAPLTIAADRRGGAAVDWARNLLANTDDLADQVLPRGWWQGVLAALGHDAAEGWPARLTQRWVGQTVAASGMLDGLTLRAPAPPRALGALSFARALGDLGVAMLRAARPATVPGFAHQHPYGLRRHRRRGLFAGLVAERAFCMRVLGLGAARRERQLRASARALLQSLRFDAWRVLNIEALAQAEPFEDAAAALSQRLFGDPAPASLSGVLPVLHHPASGAALVGQLRAIQDRDVLVEAFDEDWFLNPAAAAQLRAQDSAPRPCQAPVPATPPGSDAVPSAAEKTVGEEGRRQVLQRLVARLEAALG